MAPNVADTHAALADAAFTGALAQIRPSSARAVLDAGYQSAADVAAATRREFDTDLAELTVAAERDALFDSVRRRVSVAQWPNAAVGCDQERSTPHVVSFCQQLDEALGGGIQLTKLVEVVGSPGAGKTQLLLQLALDCVIPRQLGGPGGSAVYIDTEGSVVPARARQMADALARHLRRVAAAAVRPARSIALGPDTVSLLRDITGDAILTKLHYIRTTDAAELMAVLHTLPQTLSRGAHEDVRMVAVDSVAFPFRCGCDKIPALQGPRRSVFMAGLAQRLRAIAERHRVAVVVSNQVTTRVGDDGAVHVIPALGHSWSHEVAVRIALQRDAATGARTAAVRKGAAQPAVVPYCVTERGFRDVPRERQQGAKRPHEP